MRSPAPLPRLAVASLLLSAALLQGCANGGSMFNSAASYNDPADVCNYARQPIIEAQQSFSLNVVTGAAVSFVGNIANAINGYLAAKQQQFRSPGELIASIDRDAYRDNTNLARASASIGTLTRCRRTEAADIERSYRSHAITAADARAQLEHVHDQMVADNNLITQVLGKAGERSQTYAGARSQAASSSSRSSRTAHSGGSTATLQHTEAQAKQEQTQHEEVDTGLQKRIQDLKATVG